MTADIEAKIAELAVSTPYSAESLRRAVAAMHRRADEEDRELREEWIPNLLRVVVDLRIAGLPSGDGIVDLLPRRHA